LISILMPSPAINFESEWFILNIAVVLSDGMPNEITEACRGKGDVLYECAGTFDAEGLKKVFHSVARLPVDVLVTDTDASSENGLLAGLHAFRIVRPEARVILLVNRRRPGDDLVSGAVSLGIYDVIEADAENRFLPEFGKCLAQGYSYAKAAAWHKGFRGEADAAKKAEVREKVIIERRPVGRVTVAVASIAAGVGCTHTALMAAAFLSRYGRTALVEDSQRPVFEGISGIGENSPDSDGFRAYNTDIYPVKSQFTDAAGFLYDKVISVLAGYDYVVRDLGVLDEDRLREMHRAEYSLLVVSASAWRIMDFIRAHNSLKDDFSRFNIVSAFGSEKDVRLYRQTTGIAPVMLPACPDPSTDAAGVVFEKLLGVFLPERKPKRRFGFF